MVRWEYLKTHSIGFDERELNIAGQEGWELVSVIVSHNTDRSQTISFFFKRPYEAPKDDPDEWLDDVID